MDESHFEESGVRRFKYIFIIVLSVLTFFGLWKKEAIFGYFSFREYGEARIVIYAVPATKVSLIPYGGERRDAGYVGRDGKFTLVEKGEILDLKVSLFHPYFFPEERTFIKVEKGETAFFYAAMNSSLGSIEVRSFPAGATVFVDEEEVGTTPWKKKDIQDGTRFMLEVTMDGFIPQYRELLIEGGKNEDVVFGLVSSESIISLETDKADFDYTSLRVFLDGKLFSMEGQQLRFVPPGKRVVEVRSYDDLKIEKTINIKPGQTLHLKLPDWFVKDGS